MRAAVVHRAGEPPVVEDRAAPEAGPGRVVVDVLAAPIAPLDLLCASGTSYFGVPATPYVPGVQGVGTVAGRLVWFPTSAGMAPGDGAMAERAAATEEDLVPLPAGTDPVGLAAAGLSGVAAHQALTGTGALAAGETVIVLGAGGVVGQAAVRIARLEGAARVVGAVRSAGARERALRAGADAVVDLDTDDVTDLAKRFVEAAGAEADLVIDPLYGAPAAAAARALRPGGRLVHLGGSASDTWPLDSATLRSRSLRISGYTNNALTRAERAASITYLAGHAVPVDHEPLPLAGATAAWQRQAEGAAAGRIVLVT